MDRSVTAMELNKRSVFSARLRRLLCILLAVFCLPVFGCKKVSNSFPQLPTTSSSETPETSETSTVIVEASSEITIASSLSYETCQYLAKLYFAKQQGMLAEGVNGETVDLEYLDTIDLPFVLHTYGTSENGCDTDTLRQWKNSGDMPDIFLTNTFDQAVSEGYAMPISDYIADNRLLSADRVYTEQIYQFFCRGQQYGIPYQTSAAVLFCDMEVLRQAEVYTVPFQLNTVMFHDLLEKLSGLNAEEMTVLPFYQVSSLLPYLPSSLYRSRYLSASSEDDRKETAYRDSFDYADQLIRSGFSYESMTEEMKENFFTGLSPLLSRKVGVWAGTTDEIPVYDNYMPNTLNVMALPASTDESNCVPVLVCYPLCVSSSCKNPDLACELAAFIALDEDAQLLITRVTKREGYLPCISSPIVWKNYAAVQKYGTYMMQFQELMDQAIYIPAVSESERFGKDQEYISDEYSRLYPITEEEEV